tara:strand:- start:729 stop:1550 length:822 start_codon:yes stop_codon:yes gene_type:complete
MSQQGKKLWITGDSYGTFDSSNGAHWIKDFAKHKGCDTIFNLARGGFDNKAIVYVGREIIKNSPWPGRVLETESFNLDKDILVMFVTDPARFCHLTTLTSKFDHKLSIANLNWWVDGILYRNEAGDIIGDQVPMPWQVHMPEHSNLYSQSMNTILEEVHHRYEFEDPEHIKNMLSRFDWQWEEQSKDDLIHGVYHLHESMSNGSEMYITGGNMGVQMRRNGVNYIPNIGAAMAEGWIASPKETEEYHNQCLCNHNTPAEHYHFWRILKEKIYK